MRPNMKSGEPMTDALRQVLDEMTMRLTPPYDDWGVTRGDAIRYFRDKLRAILDADAVRESFDNIQPTMPKMQCDQEHQND